MERPKDYPKLTDYKPTAFMAETSHYDKDKADKAVDFIETLCHTKGRWDRQQFWLLPWQEQIIRDIFGVVKENGKRQFRTVYIEIPKKVGKSELAAAVALYLLYADGEASPEVYGAAADVNQANIVFSVAKKMVEYQPFLRSHSKIKHAQKILEFPVNNGFYKVISSEVGTKHGLNVSGMVIDELHVQPNRNLYDVLTKGSGLAREQPLYFLITTAGTDTHSICYELHQKALDILHGRKVDPTFYPVVYGLDEGDDWTDEANWRKVNPSLGYTTTLEQLHEEFDKAKDSPSDEATFRQLMLNEWIRAETPWLPYGVWDGCAFPVNEADLKGRSCYGGLDLADSVDIAAFVLVFPPRDEDDKYVILPRFWIPDENLERRVRKDHVPYDVWKHQGHIYATEGNVIHYGFIEREIEELGKIYDIREIAYDRWGATQMVQNLEGLGMTVVPFGQGFKDMSPPTKEFYKLLLERRIAHGGNPVLKWMSENVLIRRDPAGNEKPDKAKSREKIDGIVAAIMALDRAIRHGNAESGSVYDERGLVFI